MTPDAFRQAIANREAELARIASALDVVETRSADLHRITAWQPEVALAYEAAVLEHRA